VKDNSGAWSEEATAIVTVNKPITEDPLYQELLGLNQTLTQRINELSQQNTDLSAKADSLSQQNDDLASEVASLSQQNADLTQKIDTMNLQLLGASGAIIGLVIVTIVLTYLGRRRTPSA
jgi:outer membrane murein-binding lipoprotein Lpp